MAEELNDSVSYLLALKQSTNSASGAAPAAAREPDRPVVPASVSANSGDQPKGAEKRRSPRYKCEGSAELREDGCDVRTWATFTDISLHGCYVEAQATYPTGTVLHMKMEAAGVRFESKGTVRVTYPYLGMGIAFVDVADDNAALLKQLLARISRPCLVMGPGIASSIPAINPLGAVPIITNPQRALDMLMEFFESRQIMLRDDFLRLLKKSAGAG